MNYLAHLHLSAGKSHLMSGNLLADYLRGPDAIAELPLELRHGVALHRHIDHFTDTHQVVKEAVQLIKPSQGRYSPVALDIFYDYLLAKHWDKFNELPLQSFATDAYSKIREFQAYFPEKNWRNLHSMIQHNWLVGYAQKEALQYTFMRFVERTRFPNNLLNATEELMELEEALSNGFLVFYPELLASCNVFIERLGLNVE